MEIPKELVKSLDDIKWEESLQRIKAGIAENAIKAEEIKRLIEESKNGNSRSKCDKWSSCNSNNTAIADIDKSVGLGQ